MNRLEVRARVLDCTSCHLNARCTAPVPAAGAMPGEIAVVREAPGIDEDRSGVPGNPLLAGLLTDLGLTEVAWMSVISCAPLQEEGRSTRMPSPKEVNSCLPNLKMQLEASQASFILLAGAIPLRVFRPDLRMAKDHGTPFWQPGRLFFPVYNPEAATRNRAWMTELKTDLSLFNELVEARAV